MTDMSFGSSAGTENVFLSCRDGEEGAGAKPNNVSNGWGLIADAFDVLMYRKKGVRL